VLGLERPPRWGIVTLAMLATGNAVVFAFLTLSPAPDDPFAGRPAPVAQPPSASTASAPTQGNDVATTDGTAVSAEAPVLAVYGDGYTAGSTLGGQDAAGWPALVAAALKADLRLNAVSMAGFSAIGTTGQDFADLASSGPVPDAAVSIVFGSRNDIGSTASAVGQGAEQTLRLIRNAAPQTRLVVVGPAWSSADIPPELYVLRDAVQQAARAAGATFIDPLAAGWFSEPGALIAADGISPTDSGHAAVASWLIPVIQEALATA
jgi:lysophospholipase L1-like esterase